MRPNSHLDIWRLVLRPIAAHEMIGYEIREPTATWFIWIQILRPDRHLDIWKLVLRAKCYLDILRSVWRLM
jgi:hypothetical protein